MSMDRTKDAQRFNTRQALGSPLQIYSPPTGSTLLSGLGVLGCAAFLVWIAATYPTFMGVVLFFAIFLVVPGFSMIVIAIFNHSKRAVICMLGAALLTPQGSDSFRWTDVLTTTRLSVCRRGLTYTVHCLDGRSVVFKNFSQIQDLAETIDVQVARAKQA